MTSVSRIGIVANTEAGVDADFRSAVAKLRESGVEVEVRVAWESDQIGRFGDELLERGCELLIAAGGDGTLNRLAQAVWEHERRAQIAVLPFGTANDFAEGIDFAPVDAEAGLRSILELPVRSTDLGILDNRDRVFVNVASGGFGAEVTADTSGQLKSALGSLAYVFTGLSHLSDLNARHLSVEADGFEWSQPTLGFAVGNGTQTGGGFRVTRKALLDDGRLDLVIAPDIPTEAFREYVMTDLVDSDRIVYRRFEKICIESDRTLQLNLDGEPISGDHFEFSIEPGALLFRRP